MGSGLCFFLSLSPSVYHINVYNDCCNKILVLLRVYDAFRENISLYFMYEEEGILLEYID